LNEIRIGDCLQIMKLLVIGNVKVQTCVTSPPYFGLRDYGTATWDGGTSECDHIQTLNLKQGNSGGFSNPLPRDIQSSSRSSAICYRDVCGKCGARRIDDQIGLEETPSAYVARLVEVFRLVRELLADDGTLWLNLGDSYASGCKGSGGPSEKQLSNAGSRFEPRVFDLKFSGLNPKDLIGIPWRVAFALQADGWYLRSDIIWAKPNPMPESVTDRPTKSHEYLFLLSKSAEYFYDAEAIAEPSITGDIRKPYAPGQVDSRGNGHDRGGGTIRKSGDYGNGAGRNDGDRHPAGGWCEGLTRNRRSVWTVATQPYFGAHFATFPRDLILPCVLAGSRPGDVVFDPFMGSGTTALVAKENGRRYLGCELNPEYRALWEERLAQEVLFGPEVTA
jgi:DNA modification methylase